MIGAIRNIFTPPKLETDDFDQLSKYYLAYRATIFIAAIVTVLDIVLCIMQIYKVALITFVPLLCLAFAIYYIRTSQNFRVVGFFISFVGVLTCQFSIWFINDQPHFADLLWMVITVLFAFFLIRPVYGMIFTGINIVSAVLYVMIRLDNPELVENAELTQGQLLIQAVNICSCFLIIGYLIYQYSISSIHAKEQLDNAQRTLQHQYDIISLQNEEKTVMLKEIHHRVKNNLQIITSLLRLQARELESPEAIAKFKDATHRVIAMSMIHEKMYQTDELSTMRLKEYLDGLTKDLVSSYQSGYDVRININCTVESVGLRSIVPLALILNELISNSLKYAFDEYEDCSINIDFHHLEGTKCCLEYSDSGTWKEPNKKGSFGLDLIDSLTHQLEGTLKMTTYPKTKFEFVFSPVED